MCKKREDDLTDEMSPHENCNHSSIDDDNMAIRLLGNKNYCTNNYSFVVTEYYSVSIFAINTHKPTEIKKKINLW